VEEYDSREVSWFLAACALVMVPSSVQVFAVIISAVVIWHASRDA
jgi:hypothetical protein